MGERGAAPAQAVGPRRLDRGHGERTGDDVVPRHETEGCGRAAILETIKDMTLDAQSVGCSLRPFGVVPTARRPWPFI